MQIILDPQGYHLTPTHLVQTKKEIHPPPSSRRYFCHLSPPLLLRQFFSHPPSEPDFFSYPTARSFVYDEDVDG